MPSDIDSYRAHLRDLGLDEQQERDLIGAIQCIAESLLDKEYMLRYQHEQGRSH